MEEKTKYLKPDEYACKYRLHLNTVYKLLNAGEIKGAFKIGDQWRIPDLDQEALFSVYKDPTQ